jgi:hypothetical protein
MAMSQIHLRSILIKSLLNQLWVLEPVRHQIRFRGDAAGTVAKDT